MIKRICLFLLLIFQLYSNEEPSDKYVIFGGEPSANIAGCVNAITGEYFISELDWVVQGHEPIPIRRRFVASGGSDKKFFGWEFFFDHLVAKRTIDNNAHQLSLVIPEKFGFSLSYVATPAKKLVFKVQDFLPIGVTNCYTGEISARLNAFNNKVYSPPDQSGFIHVDAPDGTKRIYHGDVHVDEVVLNKSEEKTC